MEETKGKQQFKDTWFTIVPFHHKYAVTCRHYNGSECTIMLKHSIQESINSKCPTVPLNKGNKRFPRVHLIAEHKSKLIKEIMSMC